MGFCEKYGSQMSKWLVPGIEGQHLESDNIYLYIYMQGIKFKLLSPMATTASVIYLRWESEIVMSECYMRVDVS